MKQKNPRSSMDKGIKILLNKQRTPQQAELGCGRSFLYSDNALPILVLEDCRPFAAILRTNSSFPDWVHRMLLYCLTMVVYFRVFYAYL